MTLFTEEVAKAAAETGTTIRPPRSIGASRNTDLTKADLIDGFDQLLSLPHGGSENILRAFWYAFSDRRTREWLPEASSNLLEAVTGAFRTAISAYGLVPEKSLEMPKVPVTISVEGPLSDELLRKAFAAAISSTAIREFNSAYANSNHACFEPYYHVALALTTYADQYRAGSTEDPW